MKKLELNTELMSPFKIMGVQQQKNDKGDVVLEHDIPLDYYFVDFLKLYKKMVLSPRESYSLDFICREELDENKLEYDEDLFWLHNNDYERFIDYNTQDVLLMVNLEDKLKLHKILYTMAYEMNCNYDSIFGTVVPWTAFIYRETTAMNIVLPNDRNKNTEGFSYKGGHVECPQPGHYKGILSYDFAALYPSNQISFNISTETLIDGIEKILHPELLELREKFTRGQSIEQILPSGKKMTKDDYAEIKRVCKKHNVAMTPNGEFFDISKEGIMPAMLKRILKERKLFKNAQLKLESVYEAMKVNTEYGFSKEEITEEFMFKSNLNDIVAFLKTNDKHVQKENIHRVDKYRDFCEVFQLLKKVQANSEYGYMGNKYALLSNVRIAQSITTVGRFFVQWVRDQVNDHFLKEKGFKPFIYADTDSVLGDTKLHLMKGLNRYTKTIQELYNEIDGEIDYIADNGIIVNDPADPMVDNCTNFVKKVDVHLKSMSFNIDNRVPEYNQIKYIMKHKVNKRMFKIKYNGKEVIVTEDHSLIVIRDDEFIDISPKDIIKGDKLVVLT
jgi:DNA polymerase elongation subunit (family B)